MIYLYFPFDNEKSYGITIAYEFIKILNEFGYEAKLLCCENERYDYEIPEEIKPYYISKAAIPNKISDDDIIIYPDTVAKDAPKAKKVIYWLLNKPGALSAYHPEFRPTDILVSYSTLIHKDLPQLFILKDERKLFSSLRTMCSRNKDTISIYFGKVHTNTVVDKNEQLKRIINGYQKIHIITRKEPHLREEVLREVAQSDLLVSYDPLSNLNYEATLLGTPVLMMDDTFDIKNIGYNAGTYGFAFNEEEIGTAREQIGQAYEKYCMCLQNQKKSVAESFQRILEKTELVQTQTQVLHDNKAINEKAYRDFAVFFWRLTEPFSNTDYLEDIPLETREFLCQPDNSGVVVKTQLKWKDAMYQKKAKDLRLRELTYLLFRKMIYGVIKPQWTDAMYQKLPGNLKFKELLYLFFRRLIRPLGK